MSQTSLAAAPALTPSSGFMTAATSAAHNLDYFILSNEPLVYLPAD